VSDLEHAHPDNTDLHGDTSAENWAQRFSSMYEIRKRDQSDPDYVMSQAEADGMLLSWFAGAIETGRANPSKTSPESIAQALHEARERLAEGYGYKTRGAWQDVPEKRQQLITETVKELQRGGVI
jgi:hypothetical protein